MNGERIEENGVVTSLRSFYGEDGNYISSRRYRDDNDRLQMRLATIETRLRVVEEVYDSGIVSLGNKFPWIPMSTTSTTFVTGVEYDEETGVISTTSMTARVLGLGDIIATSTTLGVETELVSGVSYDDGTGLLSYNSKSVMVLGVISDLGSTTIAVAVSCTSSTASGT